MNEQEERDFDDGVGFVEVTPQGQGNQQAQTPSASQEERIPQGQAPQGNQEGGVRFVPQEPPAKPSVVPSVFDLPGDQHLTTEQIAEMLNFDPVATLKAQKYPKPAEATPSPQNQGQQQQQQSKPVVGQQQQQSESAAKPALSPDDRINQLAGVVQQLAQTIQPQKAEPSAEQSQKPVFDVVLPDAVFNALEAEDPATRRAAMQQVFNSFANLTFNTMGQYLHQSVIPQIREDISRGYQQFSQAQKVEQDFYGTYPHLDNQYIRQAVADTAIAYATELNQSGQFTGPTPAFNAEVAKRVHALLNIPMPQAANPSNPNPAGQGQQTMVQADPVKRPPAFWPGGGARPPSAPNQSAEFLDMIGLVPQRPN